MAGNRCVVIDMCLGAANSLFSRLHQSCCSRIAADAGRFIQRCCLRGNDADTKTVVESIDEFIDKRGVDVNARVLHKVRTSYFLFFFSFSEENLTCVRVFIDSRWPGRFGRQHPHPSQVVRPWSAAKPVNGQGSACVCVCVCVCVCHVL